MTGGATVIEVMGVVIPGIVLRGVSCVGVTCAGASVSDVGSSAFIEKGKISIMLPKKKLRNKTFIPNISPNNIIDFMPKLFK